MRIFVTGGTDLIGSAVRAEPLAHRHDILGLAQSEGSAAVDPSIDLRDQVRLSR